MQLAALLSTRFAIQAKASDSAARLTVSSKSGTHGLKLIDLLTNIYLNGLAIQGNLARSEASYVSMAASMGLTTTKVDSRSYGGKWRLTPKGVDYLVSAWQ